MSFAPMALTNRAIVKSMIMKTVLPNIVITSVRKCRIRASIALNSAERLGCHRRVALRRKTHSGADECATEHTHPRSGFSAMAEQLGGAALRELVRPWLQGVVTDKTKRTLTLTIRRVPAVGMFALSATRRDRVHPSHHARRAGHVSGVVA
jgi:hypothetical protein